MLPLTGYAVDSAGNIKIMSPLGIGSLFEWMWQQRHHPTYLRQAFGILRDFASGMAFIHNQALVHGDLKPGNIILFDEGGSRPVGKVADFGLARVRDDKSIFSSKNEITGTVCFRAPEIATQDPNPKVGKRKPADVWAFGMICYSLSENGYEPYKEFAQKLAAIRMGERPVCRKGTHPDLVKLYQSCCQEEPSDRPTFEDLIPVIDQIIASLDKAC